MNRIVNLGSIKGPPGENSIADIVARGKWDNATAYVRNDLVMCSDGNAYISLRDNVGKYPPDSPNDWIRFVARGAVGPQGEQGETGEQGPKGEQGQSGTTVTVGGQPVATFNADTRVNRAGDTMTGVLTGAPATGSWWNGATINNMIGDSRATIRKRTPMLPSAWAPILSSSITNSDTGTPNAENSWGTWSAGVLSQTDINTSSFNIVYYQPLRATNGLDASFSFSPNGNLRISGDMFARGQQVSTVGHTHNELPATGGQAWPANFNTMTVAGTYMFNNATYASIVSTNRPNFIGSGLSGNSRAVLNVTTVHSGAVLQELTAWSSVASQGVRKYMRARADANTWSPWREQFTVNA